MNLSSDFPEIINARLYIKEGTPLADVRKNYTIPQDFQFSISDGFLGLLDKICSILSSIMLPRNGWQFQNEIYFKPALNTKQKHFILLQEDVFVSKLNRAWNQATRRQGGRPLDFKFEFFIYIYTKSLEDGDLLEDSDSPVENNRLSSRHEYEITHTNEDNLSNALMAINSMNERDGVSGFTSAVIKLNGVEIPIEIHVESLREALSRSNAAD